VTRSDLSRVLLGVLFIGAGVLHFVVPEMYVAMIPPGYPAPRALVLWSGVAEIAGGIGLLVPWRPLRRWAGWGLVLLLVAVYPANVQMALTTEAPFGLLWMRLALQGVLVAWVLRASGVLGQSRPSNTPGHASRASSTG
jgi:uncharacterized membrane protein